MKKIMFATIVAVAAISGFIGYSKATTSSISALALVNVEALSREETEDKKGEYFVVDNSKTSSETEDLGDMYCITETILIGITCPSGGYSDCTPIQEEIVNKRYVKKQNNS